MHPGEPVCHEAIVAAQALASLTLPAASGVPFELAPQRIAADAQYQRGFSYGAIASLAHARDVLLLDIGQGAQPDP